MKTPSPASNADSLVEYLTLHTPIFTEQGINVQAFIERLTAFKDQSTAPDPESKRRASKSKTGKKFP